MRQLEKDLNITNEQNLKSLAHLQQNVATETQRNAEFLAQLDRLTEENQQLKRSLDGAKATIMKKDEELGDNHKATTKLEAMLKRKETEIDSLKQCLVKEKELFKATEGSRVAVEKDLTLLKEEFSSQKESLQWLQQFTAELRKPDKGVMYAQSTGDILRC